MNKKLAILLLAGFLFSGCGASDSKDKTSENQEQTQTENTNQIQDAVNDENRDTESEPETEQQVYVLDFEGTTIDGETMTSECFADSKLTMINVWATFCNPCLSEMPDLGEIANSYDTAEFQMIGIISDVLEDSDEAAFEEAKELIEQTNADYPHLLLNEELYMNLVGASDSVPTTYFFNQKGELLGCLVGAQSKETWEEIIHGLLEEMEQQ